MEFVSSATASHFPNPFRLFLDPASRVYWLYLLSSLGLAIAVILWRGKLATPTGTKKKGFSLELITHPSAVTDYVYFFVNTILFGLLILPFLSGLTAVCGMVESGLRLLFTSPSLTPPSGILLITGFALVQVLVMDLSLWVVHMLAHRIPFLWEFHKVHHSAAVMTPLTAFRNHPLDDFLALSATILGSGLLLGTVRFLFAQDLPILTFSGINLFIFAAYFFGWNLRHSPVWIAYPAIISRIIISPAQHQIHHSALKKHSDLNFGFIFALWDWMAGTLYIPKEQEEFPFGIGEKENQKHIGILALYTQPFRGIAKLFRKKVP